MREERNSLMEDMDCHILIAIVGESNLVMGEREGGREGRGGRKGSKRTRMGEEMSETGSKEGGRERRGRGSKTRRRKEGKRRGDKYTCRRIGATRRYMQVDARSPILPHITSCFITLHRFSTTRPVTWSSER